MLFFGGIVLAGVGTWFYQAYNGYGVTGIRWPVYWGFYITSFVFWIGISHAGTLISAILRLVQAEWRRPVTRCAEVITVFALMIGALFPIMHLGRPWLFFWLAPYPSERLIWPNFRSPLVWDFFAINTYLTGSVLFLLLPMIPDFAVVRDKSTGLRKKIYGVLALGWRGTPKQWHRLETAMSIMAVVILPVAVSVHTIVSFDFSMAPVPMWQSTVFGPYFVAGAIFSGIAGLIIAMAFLRKFLHLETYLQPVHFENLGKLLLVMAVLWGYFVFNERLVTYYGNEPAEMAVFWRTQRESFAPLYWTMVDLQLRPAADPDGHQVHAPHHHRLRDRVAGRGGGDVARAVPDHRAVARPQVPALCLRHLPAAADRGDHRRRDVRRDDAAVRALRQGRADHLDVGAEDAGARARSQATRRRRGRRSVRCGREGGLRALRRRPRGAAGREPPARGRAEGSATSRCCRAGRWRSSSSATSTRPPGCGGSPAAARLVGMAVAYGLAWITENSWPMNVGGLPTSRGGRT